MASATSSHYTSRAPSMSPPPPATGLFAPLSKLFTAPTSLSALFTSENGQTQLQRLLQAIPTLLNTIASSAGWDDEKVNQLKEDFNGLQQAQFKSRNAKTAHRAIDSDVLERIQEALGQIQAHIHPSTLQQQYSLSIDWLTSLQNAVIDDGTSPLISIISRHKQAFDKWLTTLAGVDGSKFTEEEWRLVSTPRLLFDNNAIANPVFLRLLVKDTKAFSLLCKEIGGDDAKAIKDALGKAKIGIPQTLQDKVHYLLDGTFNLALYTAIARFALPSLDTPYTPSLGNWTMATISGLSYMAIKHIKCEGNDPIRYGLEKAAEKCQLEWALTSLKSGWAAIKEVKEGVVAFADGVPFIGKALASPKWTASIAAAYLARQQFNTSLWTTGAIACALPAWEGSTKARAAAALLMAYDWHLVSASIPVITTTLNTAGAVLGGAAWAANTLHQTNSTVAYIAAAAFAGACGRYLHKNLHLTKNLPYTLERVKAAVTTLISSNPIELAKKSIVDLVSDTPVDNKKASAPKSSQPIPSIFSLLDQKGALNTLLSPIQKMMDLPYNAMKTVVTPDTLNQAAVNKLFKDAGIDPAMMAPVSALLSYIEAVLNWAGKIPVVCILSGSVRSTLGFSVAAAGTAIGVTLIASSVLGNAARSRLGAAVVREALLNGGSNMARGLIESSSWMLSLMLTTPWDLCGKRFSYLQETPAKLHIPFMLGAKAS